MESSTPTPADGLKQTQSQTILYQGLSDGYIVRLPHFEINIYSSRTSQPSGIEAMKSWLRKHAETYFEDHNNRFRDSAGECTAIFMQEIKFPLQKPAAFLTIDDRAVQFKGDWSHPSMDPKILLAFKPWNRE